MTLLLLSSPPLALVRLGRKIACLVPFVELGKSLRTKALGFLRSL